jgi:hypothetical protein
MKKKIYKFLSVTGEPFKAMNANDKNANIPIYTSGMCAFM